MTDDIPKEWPSWEDAMGIKFEKGDWVAIATVNGKSPQLVIGIVNRINRVNSKGEEILRNNGHWETDPDTGEQRYLRETVPSATVTVTPMVDGRRFYRSSQRRKNTYQFPANMVKVDPSLLVAQQEAQHAALRDEIMEMERELRG